MKRICFIAQFPPPIHGLSKAVETLYTSALQSKYLFQQINLTNNKEILKTLWTNAWRELARSTNTKIITIEKKKMFDSFAWRILSHFDRKRLWKITKKPKL